MIAWREASQVDASGGEDAELSELKDQMAASTSEVTKLRADLQQTRAALRSLQADMPKRVASSLLALMYLQAHILSVLILTGRHPEASGLVSAPLAAAAHDASAGGGHRQVSSFAVTHVFDEAGF